MLNEKRIGRRPFAYSVDKMDYIFVVRPSLPLAIESARSRIDPPSCSLAISAWFADGTRDEIPYDLLSRARQNRLD